MLAATVVVHLIISFVHGAAHSGAHVDLSRAGSLFVYVVILAGPLAGLALSFWRLQIGAMIVAVTMSASLVFGAVNHFIIPGSDHVTHVAREWRVLFAATAALLVVVEAAGAAVGFRLAVHDIRRAS